MSKMIDRTGWKYGKLTVLFRDTETKKKGVFWMLTVYCGRGQNIFFCSQYVKNVKQFSTFLCKTQNVIFNHKMY